MYMQDPIRGLGDFAPAGSSSLDRRRLLAFGDDDMPFYVPPEFNWTPEDDAAYSDTNIPGIDTPSNAWSGFWTGVGSLVSPFVTAATTVGVNKILTSQNSSYLIDPKTGRPQLNSSGQPILANSTAGIALAAARAKADATPSWVMPVAIGAGVLALVMLVGKGRR